jgi:UDP-N-acetylglucosamine:LPS N-acetylglucosamine transferase
MNIVQNELNKIIDERVLISPLNWGIGHITRTISIIKILLNQNNTVFICCDSKQKEIYMLENIDVQYVLFKGYPFEFSGDGNWGKDLIKKMPALLSFMRKESRNVNQLVEKFDISLVVSDQRFGFYSKRIKSVIISHQLKLPVTGINQFAQYCNYVLLAKFDAVWVPDDMMYNLSGSLSKHSKLKKVNIGLQSRFSNAVTLVEDLRYSYIGIVSGPLPYASSFAKLLIEKMNKLQCFSVIVLPNLVSQVVDIYVNDNVKVVIQPSTFEMERLIKSSKVVISRAGYSTLMDLTVLQKRAILIPTPGQNEQLYLAKHHHKHKDWCFYSESEFKKMEL